MADRLDPARRSRNMSKIRGKDTKPELAFRRALHREGLRYRLHAKDLPGRPDLVFRKARVAVFVNGCFWHRHAGCTLAYSPKSNLDFWAEKFSANVERDRRSLKALGELGWKCVVVWECETKNAVALRRQVLRVKRAVGR
ncbi:DNA mismatch endonuclease Vsr [Ramlibacter sp.]|uniref:very short patch repair endonuclease n=1 Tax=Ramlibacter sp. TaxID=1917967 RepID=UPI002D5E2595|nr:DNA mismatch endonuclease Vsr [Ramlibacter sp.]HYD77546.1 DNA mismatch endonuclease Vsr [Ramlibacter sp.]